jgi:6-phosphogluconolactonase
MSGGITVVVHRDAAVLAEAVAARLLTRLADAQASRGWASVVLTGGTIGIAALEAVRRSPARAAVDWSRVDVWWGDERFVDPSSDDRNELQARRALLDDLVLDPARVHPMGSPAAFPTAEEAADAYAAELAAAAAPGLDVPLIDVLLLGMGPEGHVASIFPESPAAHDERTAFAVHDCPKPPPTRVSLGFSALQEAREVWVIVAGAEKATAVSMALGGAGQVQVPAAGARGSAGTLWLLDEPAAQQLRRTLRRH